MNSITKVIEDHIENVYDESLELFWNNVNIMVHELEQKEFGYFNIDTRPLPSLEDREEFRKEFFFKISNLIKQES